jgi:hypothetical protein
MRKNALPTGAAQPVTNTLERVRAIFKDRPEPGAPPERERRNFRKRKAEADEAEEPIVALDADKPETEGAEDEEGEE